jgi:hypothetical protein
LKKIEERKKKHEMEAQINNVVGKSIASILKEKISRMSGPSLTKVNF